MSDSRGRHDVQTCSLDNGNGAPIPSPLTDTRLSIQCARGRSARLCGFHTPSKLITLLAEHDWTRPLSVHRLPESESDNPQLLITDRFLFVGYSSGLQIVSCRLSETRMDAEQLVNEDVVAEFPFVASGEQVLAVYRLTAEGGAEEPMTRTTQDHTYMSLARTEQEIYTRRPKVDTCVVVTNQAVYKIVLG